LELVWNRFVWPSFASRISKNRYGVFGEMSTLSFHLKEDENLERGVLSEQRLCFKTENKRELSLTCHKKHKKYNGLLTLFLTPSMGGFSVGLGSQPLLDEQLLRDLTSKQLYFLKIWQLGTKTRDLPRTISTR
jgi:hypothetical protein